MYCIYVHYTNKLSRAKHIQMYTYIRAYHTHPYALHIPLKLILRLDIAGDGLLTWSEFEQLLEDPKLRFLLDKLEIAAAASRFEAFQAVLGCGGDFSWWFSGLEGALRPVG